jgi:hypothetical protein
VLWRTVFIAPNVPTPCQRVCPWPTSANYIRHS